MTDPHSGSCHCGAVRFEVTLEGASISEGIYRFNCSLCRKKGIVMKPMPGEAFALVAGQENLSVYQWNKNIAAHYFCRTCGVYTHHRRRRDPSQISVNFECLEGVETPSAESIGLANGAEHE